MTQEKRILCFGDSNTWGCIPRWEASPLPSERYDEKTRWTRVMASELGPGWTVLEEGLGGRTTMFDAPGESYRRGDWYIHPCLLSHRPLDYVVLMLGTNDIQPRLHAGPFSISDLKEGMKRVISIIQSLPECGPSGKAEPAQILLISPPPIRKAQGRPEVWEKYGKEQGLLLSGEFAGIYGEIAREMGCGFLDGAAYAQADLSDGVHFTRDSHPRLGMAAARAIREMEDAKDRREKSDAEKGKPGTHPGKESEKSHQKPELKKDIEM